MYGQRINCPKNNRRMLDRYSFKAKRIDNGEWVQGSLFERNLSTYIALSVLINPIISSETNTIVVEVNKYTICQCTGCHDKNGKLIWENDIIQHRDSDKIKKAYIKYSTPFFVLHSTLGIYSSDTLADFSKIEVIGNRFDNPELLLN